MSPLNKKKQWGVFVEGPTPENHYSKLSKTPENDYFWKKCGKLLGMHVLYYSRQEADKCVKLCNNEFWIYIAQKYNPRLHELS